MDLYSCCCNRTNSVPILHLLKKPDGLTHTNKLLKAVWELKTIPGDHLINLNLEIESVYCGSVESQNLRNSFVTLPKLACAIWQICWEFILVLNLKNNVYLKFVFHVCSSSSSSSNNSVQYYT